MWTLAGELLLSLRAEGAGGRFAAVSIRKRDSEISVGISESEQPQAEASDQSAIDHAFNQRGRLWVLNTPQLGDVDAKAR